MAKLNKEKFTYLGGHEEDRTTYQSDINIHIHYDTKEEYFYFEYGDILKHFSKEEITFASSRAYFSGCDTKQKAISAMKFFIEGVSDEKRFLKISLGMNNGVWKVNNPDHNNNSMWNSDKFIPNPELPSYLIDILERGMVYNCTGLTIKIERLIRFKADNFETYTICNENWEYNASMQHFPNSNELIEWTQEREDFFVDIENKLNGLSRNVLDFFKEGSIDKLLLKIDNGKFTLGE